MRHSMSGLRALLVAVLCALCVPGALSQEQGISASVSSSCEPDWIPTFGESMLGMDSAVNALTVFDGALYAGGSFTTAGGVTVNRIAKWGGTSWSELGSGMNNPVDALTVFDGALYAGGQFTTADGVMVNRIAKWDGTSWSTLQSGIAGFVHALAVFDGVLCAGGSFTTSPTGDSYLAKWGCDIPSGPNPWSDVGGGKPGTGGLTPLLTGSGFLTDGSLNALHLSQALPNSSAHLILGISVLNVPLKGGTLVPAADFVVYGLPVSGTGTLDLPFPWSGIAPGISLWYQYWVVDPEGTFGFAASNGLRGESQ